MPRGLPKNVKICLEKAHDSALLAVEMYNKPAVKFKSGGYIVLMTIAWTSLLHAIFFREKIKPFHRKKNSNRFEKKEGDYVYWELSHCLKKYFKDDTENPIRINLEFFIPLRNIIEHKSLPELDPNLFAECQAMLINFDRVMEEEFGSKYCLKESLSFSLQLFPSSDNYGAAVKTKEAKKAINFINDYRSSLSTETLESGQYSFKAFLMQVANHNSQDALPIQFIRYDNLSPEEKGKVKRVAALVKFKERPVYNADLLKPKDVICEVQRNLGDPKIERNGVAKDKFNSHMHIQAWKYYGVRPPSSSEKPEETEKKYCLYDSLNEGYGYTQEWINFLSDKLKDDNEFERVRKHRNG